MPGDLRKVSLLAVILVVLLRISIGWHLMYEGLWKLSTQQTSSPWTAEGYLKNATGPLRPTFRAMTGDPDDLRWLDFDGMSRKWQDWRERFVAHYQLNESQKADLDLLFDGPETYQVSLAKLPPGLDLAKVDGVSKEAVTFDAKTKKLIVSGKLHLLPAEKARLIAAATELAYPVDDQNSEEDKSEDKKPEVPKTEDQKTCDQFVAAITRAYEISSRLSINQQLTALLKGDPERVGIIQQAKGSSKSDAEKDADEVPVVVQVGGIQYYKELIERFNKNYERARTKTEWDHIEKQWKDLQDLRRKLVSPIQSLEKQMQADAEGLLTTSQLAAGPVPTPLTPIRQIDLRTMWGLTIFGLLLMLGLFTRLSALGGAGLLALFYLAMPPWPGVQEIPSIEHNLFVNKVFVEMLALLVIASLPSGKWFGLDAAISALFRRRRK
ncbi:MAG: hypothetical protein JSS49_24320 [Planctomycetes bacterium]|nr:hypothetical protein [Planctomycetota bacterium]